MKLSNSTARVGESIAATQVAVPTGNGNSFTTAAVTIPNVPSAPMNRCLRS